MISSPIFGLLAGCPLPTFSGENQNKEGENDANENETKSSDKGATPLNTYINTPWLNIHILKYWNFIHISTTTPVFDEFQNSKKTLVIPDLVSKSHTIASIFEINEMTEKLLEIILKERYPAVFGQCTEELIVEPSLSIAMGLTSVMLRRVKPCFGTT